MVEILFKHRIFSIFEFIKVKYNFHYFFGFGKYFILAGNGNDQNFQGGGYFRKIFGQGGGVFYRKFRILTGSRVFSLIKP